MIDTPIEVKIFSELELNSSLRELWNQLLDLHHVLRDYSYSKYQRINPFCEDLFNWKERGSYWGNESKDITIYNSATLIDDVKIGQKTWIGPFCLLDGTGGLSIGEYCTVSTGCQILTHDTVKWTLSRGKNKYEYAPTKIGNCTFLGTHSVVIKGVSIGDHCVVAAGSVVTKNVPDFTIVAGTPARPIGKVILEQENVILEYFKVP